MKTWLIQEELLGDDGRVALACPYCSRPDRRDADRWRDLTHLRVGCPGCGCTSYVPNIDRKEEPT